MDTSSNLRETHTNVHAINYITFKVWKNTQTQMGDRIYICWIEENKLAVSQDLMIF
jgi:hypothetical protein